MSELRHDPFTRGWVIVAPERTGRPHQVRQPAPPPPRHPPACPFCPGHEQDTPAELWRAVGADGQWQVRVVGNRFPALAGALRTVLAGLSGLLGDPDYNYVVHSAPVGEERTEYFLWHVQILPRLSVPAGFELGSGMAINPSLPEATAAALRAEIAKLGQG